MPAPKRSNEMALKELPTLFLWFTGPKDMPTLERVMAQYAARGETQARQVLFFKLYYGLSGKPPMTYPDMAAEHGMSKNRARIIVSNAINGMRFLGQNP